MHSRHWGLSHLCFTKPSDGKHHISPECSIPTKYVHRGWPLLGSIAVILLLGTGLFTQNVVTQHRVVVELPDESSLVFISQNYDVFTNESNITTATPRMISSILTGLVAPNGPHIDSGDDSSIRNSLFGCPTENCTFGFYTTLNICPACVDTTNSIRLDNNVHYLPNSTLTLLESSGIANFTSDTMYPNAPEFADIDVGPLIVRYQAIVRDNLQQTPMAAECVAFWCVTTYAADVVSNNLQEERIFRSHTDESTGVDVIEPDSFTNTSQDARTHYGQQNNITIIPDVAYINDTAQTATAFTISAEAQRALQYTLTVSAFGAGPLLHGSIETIDNSSRTSSLTAHIIFNSESPYDFSEAPPNDSNDPEDRFFHPEDSFTNMTHYMAYALRMSTTTGSWYTFGSTVTES